MPRGSKLGERRGGRDRGTPNRRTIFVDRILAIASECPTTSARQFIDILLKDQTLPADLRMAVALGTSPRSSTNKPKVQSAGPRPEPSAKAKQISLEILFGIVLDTRSPADQRRKAALEATQYLLPKKPGPKKWWVNAPIDEYGFAITAEIAAEYRDAKYELRHLSDSGSNSSGTSNKVNKLKRRINAILHRLQCPCPSKHGEQQRKQDAQRLIYFLKKREANEGLSAEQNAEEAHRRARLDSIREGPESAARQRLYVLEEKQRLYRKRIGPRLARKERTDLRFLRLLYPPRSSPDNPEFHLLGYHPLRDEPLAEDGNLYPPNSILRPLEEKDLKDEAIEEEFVDLPRYCYPPHARLPPLKDADVLYIDPAGFRWSNKLLG